MHQEEQQGLDKPEFSLSQICLLLSNIQRLKLTKTDFLIFSDCAHNAWFKVNQPEVYNAKPLSAFDLGLIETGNEVDALARDLFPGGVELGRGEIARTRQLVESRSPILYQPAFETERFSTACDILVFNASTAVYDLYEVKASTNGDDKAAKNELYTDDIAFQANVLAECNVPLGVLYLVRLNSDYVRGDELDIRSLFSVEDFTVRFKDVQAHVLERMNGAFEFVSRPHQPSGPCDCIYKGRSAHCTTFQVSNPDVPSYSVHDISRIGSSKKKLADLVDRHILAIEDVPDYFELSDIQSRQVQCAKSGREVVDPDAIEALLCSYQFPLAFFDYETYPAAIPRFRGYGPFDQIPFQFSLDVLTAPDGEVQHFEFLDTAPGAPDLRLIEALQAFMPPRGSIVTWNKQFEIGINKKLAVREPQSGSFLAGLNARIVDLMQVFSSQAYVHPGFKGRTSIKYILPVLVPELSYAALDVKEGGTASQTWNAIVTGNLPANEAAAKKAALLTYCALDTRAMWEIWRVLVR
jgi:Domain of unknown function(DUF2779)